MTIPSFLAVFRLISRSMRIGCSTGRSAGFALVAHSSDAHHSFKWGVLIERDVAAGPVRDHQFPQRRAGDHAADLGMVGENRNAFANPANVIECRRRIPGEVEFEDALQVGEGFRAENDHAMRRAFGRTAVLPSARRSR